MNITSIQWGDSTVNPAMGCAGCELFPESPRRLMSQVDDVLNNTKPSHRPEGGALESWSPGTAREIMERCIHRQVESIRSHPGYHAEHHRDRLTTTNIWHMRRVFAEEVGRLYGKEAAEQALAVIHRQVTCYAAKLHLNRGYSILNPGRGINRGYAPTFETLTRFPGRVATMARTRDLLGTSDPNSPWKDGLPRLIFISDMGDALSHHSSEHLAWLEREVLEPVRSDKGRRHLWLWLTKRPRNMALFAEKTGGFPPNVCAMTTLTSGDRRSLLRLDQIRQVQASSRGLSVEPLWERIPPEDLDLTGIDWLILGGESGDRKARPFDLAWARELRDHCREQGVAFFLKQLGRNPVLTGDPLRLEDPHGGDWSEWPADLRVREFPDVFWNYRPVPGELVPVRPSSVKGGKATVQGNGSAEAA